MNKNEYKMDGFILVFYALIDRNGGTVVGQMAES